MSRAVRICRLRRWPYRKLWGIRLNINSLEKVIESCKAENDKCVFKAQIDTLMRRRQDIIDNLETIYSPPSQEMQQMGSVHNDGGHALLHLKESRLPLSDPLWNNTGMDGRLQSRSGPFQNDGADRRRNLSRHVHLLQRVAKIVDEGLFSFLPPVYHFLQLSLSLSLSTTDTCVLSVTVK
jgi:hypothetical protein